MHEIRREIRRWGVRAVSVGLVAFLLLCLFLLLPSRPVAAQSPVVAQSPRVAQDSLEVGTSLSITLHTLPVIAVERGFDREEGLNLSVRAFPSGAAMVEAVAAGHLMVGQAGDVPSVALAAAAPVRIVALLTDSGANYTFWVREDLQPQRPEDLYGTTIAIPFGSISHVIFNSFLERYDLDPSRINLVDLSPAAIAAAYARGDVDGFILWSPGWNQAIRQRPSILVHDAYTSYFPAQPGPQRLGTAYTVIFAREEILNERPELVESYLRVLLRAKGFWDDPRTRGEAQEIIAQALGMDVSLLHETDGQIVFDISLTQDLVDHLYSLAELLYKEGRLRRMPPRDLAGWIDPTPLRNVAPDRVTIP